VLHAADLVTWVMPMQRYSIKPARNVMEMMVNNVVLRQRFVRHLESVVSAGRYKVQCVGHVVTNKGVLSMKITKYLHYKNKYTLLFIAFIVITFCILYKNYTVRKIQYDNRINRDAVFRYKEFPTGENKYNAMSQIACKLPLSTKVFFDLVGLPDAFLEKDGILHLMFLMKRENKSFSKDWVYYVDIKDDMVVSMSDNEASVNNHSEFKPWNKYPQK
jgi:hypothetical protein